jgi:hypothetical protein
MYCKRRRILIVDDDEYDVDITFTFKMILEDNGFNKQDDEAVLALQKSVLLSVHRKCFLHVSQYPRITWTKSAGMLLTNLGFHNLKHWMFLYP